MNTKKRTLQDILAERWGQKFVGRTQELGWFRRNLALSPDDLERKFIVSVSGQGGVGKTWLLKRFRTLADDLGALTTWSDEAETDVPGVMGIFAEQLEQAGHPLKKFSERYRVYRAKKQEIEADPQAPQGFAAFLGRTIAVGGLRLARRVPVGRAIAELVDERAFGEQASEFATYVARKLSNKDEVRLVLKPVAKLTPLFLQDVTELAEERAVVLFFDTFEKTDVHLDDWLREVLEGRYGPLPTNIVFAIADRHPLSEAWVGYQPLMEPFSLEPFSDDEAREYLAKHGVTDEATVSVILSLSGRVPMWVATLAAQGPDDPAKVGDPAGDAVSRYLCWVEDEARRNAVLDAALPRSLNQDIFACLVGEDKARELFPWLQSQPFVLKRPQGWAYHSDVRTHILRYKYQQSPRTWSDLHGRLTEYFRGQRDALGLDEEAGRRDPTWQEHELSALYHTLCQAPRSGLPQALNGFLAALKAKRDFASRWAEIVVEAGRDTQNETLESWGTRLTLGLKAYEEKDYAVAVDLGDDLICYEALTTKMRSTAFAWRGYLHLFTNKYGQALTDLDQAIELDDKSAWAIASRGVTYGQMERYEETLADLNRAIELDEKDAWAIVSRGVTYRQMGRYEEALADLNRAIELEPESDWYYYSRSLSYRCLNQLQEAEADLTQAITLAERTQAKAPRNWRNAFNLSLYRLVSGCTEETISLYRQTAEAGAGQYLIRDAITGLEDLLRLFPDQPGAQQVLSYLRDSLKDTTSEPH